MTPAAARTRWWVPCDVVAQGLASHRSTGPIEDGRWFQPDDGHWSGRKRRVVAPIGAGVAEPVVQPLECQHRPLRRPTARVVWLDLPTPANAGRSLQFKTSAVRSVIKRSWGVLSVITWCRSSWEDKPPHRSYKLYASHAINTNRCGMAATIDAAASGRTAANHRQAERL